jgi:uncharacterized protein YndB with AHSA1/START domain
VNDRSMKYAVLMYADPAETKAMSAADLEVVMAKHEALRTELTASGELLGGDGLAYPEETRTLRWGNDDVAVGPLIESRQHLTAYYVIDCADLDRALAIAEHVLDFHVTAAEVRRIHDSVDTARPAGLMLEMTRMLPATPSVVFRLFDDASELAKWWGPNGFTTPRLDFDPRVGESYRIEMQPPEGDRFHLTGEFREVDPPVRLAYTFVWEPPDPDDVETRVGLTFRDLGSATEVAFTQGPFKTEDRRALHRDGWTDGFDKLERLVAAQP